MMYRCLCQGQQMDQTQSRFQAPQTFPSHQRQEGNYGQFNNFNGYPNYNPYGNSAQSNPWGYQGEFRNY